MATENTTVLWGLYSQWSVCHCEGTFKGLIHARSCIEHICYNVPEVTLL